MIKFYRCRHCGNVIVKVVDSGVPVVCCGEVMGELKPNTTDGAVEKHVPVIEKKNGKTVVRVGEVPHPMTAEHYIPLIVATNKDGFEIKKLAPNDKPEVTFEGASFTEFYAFCNLHGLWLGK